MLGGTLGPYRIDRELGAGGMGKVYAATVAGRVPGLAEGTVVALKVVHPHLLETPGFFKRFLREAEIGKSVVHENVVRTFECDSLAVDGRRADFLVMEYVEGQTLRDLLHELGGVPEELCRHVGREAAKGLAAIHAAGVIHRDMKPENVLITRDHQVKVMDLGVARLQDEAMRLSQTGAFVGSIHYAAPESFREGGKDVDGRADLHALGLVLYELACGVNPYYAESVPEILRKVLHEEPRRLGDVNPQLSPFFEEVVHCLLAKDPDARFADANALVAVLGEGEDSAWWQSRSKAIRAETHRPLRRIRIPRETAVYGRESELAHLRSLFERASKGDGQVVLVEGEAGIGKSRVVDELVGRLQHDGEDVNFLFGSYPPGGAATAAGAFSTAFREQFGDADLAETVRERLGPAAILAPAFAALLLGSSAPGGSEPLTRDSLQTCFVHTLRSLAAERPTVLLIDDLHFATEDARALFTSLAMAVPGHRVVLVGTTRPGADEKWVAGLTRLPQTNRMALGRLGPKDLVALLKDSFRSEALAASLSAQIAVKSDGNPFFAFEIIRGLREGQFITQRDDGTWVSSRVIDEIRIPSSVLDLVNARVADLTQEERDLLDVASCVGYEFDPGVVATALGAPLLPTLKQFAAIEKRHRLVRAAGRRLVFDHHQVQEALYGSLYEQIREAYHAAVASALESQHAAATTDPASLDGALCVDIAEHFLRGAQGARALRYLDAALTHLARGYVNDRALQLADRALAVRGLLAGAERARVLVRKAGRLELLGRRDAQAAAVEEACALADATQDAGLRASARTARANFFRQVSRFAEAVPELTAVLELARAAGDRRAEMYASGSLGTVYRALGRYAESQAEHERSLALAQELGDVDGEAAARINRASILSSLGRHAEAQAQCEQGLALARKCGNRRWETNATGNLGGILHAFGRHAEALVQSERFLALAREIGDRRGEAGATGNNGSILASLGRHAEAVAQHERHLVLAREIGDRQGEATALVSLGLAKFALGDAGPARAAFESSLALSREIGARWAEGYALAALGEVADEEGDAERARGLLEQAVALRRAIGHADGVAESLVILGDHLRRTGDVGGARAALEEAAKLAGTHGWHHHEALALAALACLPGGAAKAAEAEAAAVVAGSAAHDRTLRLLLWQATHDRAHIAEAKRLLDDLLARNPPEFHESMRTKLRVNREIVAGAGIC